MSIIMWKFTLIFDLLVIEAHETTNQVDMAHDDSHIVRVITLCLSLNIFHA